MRAFDGGPQSVAEVRVGLERSIVAYPFMREPRRIRAKLAPLPGGAEVRLGRRR